MTIVTLFDASLFNCTGPRSSRPFFLFRMVGIGGVARALPVCHIPGRNESRNGTKRAMIGFLAGPVGTTPGDAALAGSRERIFEDERLGEYE